jgi:hypothetical protein
MQSLQHLPQKERVKAYLRRADEFQELHRMALSDHLKVLYLDMARFMTERAMVAEGREVAKQARAG